MIPGKRLLFSARRLSPLIVLASLLLPLAVMAQTLPQTLTLVTVEDSLETEIGINVVREAYARIGIEVEIRKYAGRIALEKSNSGEVDGEVHRIDGIQNEFSNLVQVPIPINYFEIAIYSKNPDLSLTSWFDLAPYEIGIVRGVIAVERGTRGMEVRKVDSYAELIQLLLDDDVQVMASPEINTRVLLAGKEYSGQIVMNGVMETYLLYHYLHRKNEHLVSVIRPVLKSMLLDGTIARIIRETNRKLEENALAGGAAR